MKNNILKQIRSCRKKLNSAVKRTGLNSIETRKISDKMNELINEYYSSIETVKFPSSSYMNDFYKTSYESLKKITEEFNKFPSIVEWNKYAKENNLLSSITMEYITTLDWNYLRAKIIREINEKI